MVCKKWTNNNTRELFQGTRAVHAVLSFSSHIWFDYIFTHKTCSSSSYCFIFRAVSNTRYHVAGFHSTTYLGTADTKMRILRISCLAFSQSWIFVDSSIRRSLLLSLCFVWTRLTLSDSGHWWSLIPWLALNRALNVPRQSMRSEDELARQGWKEGLDAS